MHSGPILARRIASGYSAREILSIDVGGIVGLVHITQIESSRPFTHPSEVVRPADAVLVRVKRFNPETERLELTMKLAELSR